MSKIGLPTLEQINEINRRIADYFDGREKPLTGVYHFARTLYGTPVRVAVEQIVEDVLGVKYNTMTIEEMDMVINLAWVHSPLPGEK